MNRYMSSERSSLIYEIVSMTDRLSVMRRKQESMGSLHNIYEQYRDSLLILAIALSHDVNIAEDAVHDVFVAFAQSLENFKLTGSLN